VNRDRDLANSLDQIEIALKIFALEPWRRVPVIVFR
jgi:hypothetical protein